MKNNKEPLYPFVDNIRFISMLSIVCYHSFLIIYTDDKSRVEYSINEQISIFSYLQTMRFGNICFFLISGLLFGSKMKGKSNLKQLSLDYIKRRINVLIPPALLFTVIMLFINILALLYKKEPIRIEGLIDVLFSEWFIFALIIGMWLIHLVGKSLIFLFLMLCVSIALGLDIYFQWVPIINHHHFASLGFLTYLFIGYHLGLRGDLFTKILSFVQKNTKFFIFIIFLFYAWSLYDCFALYKLSSHLPLNNLKISNQILAFFTFFYLCVKLTQPIGKNIINPRVETVGIYFVHQIVMLGYNVLIKFGLKIWGINNRAEIPGAYILPLAVLSALLIYPTSLLIVKKLSRTKYSKWIGIVRTTSVSVQ